MKKLVLILASVALLGLANSQAEDKKEDKKKAPAPTTEQKKYRKELTEKYDANKDGKLDKEERAKITEEEKDKAGYAKKKEKK